MRSRRQSRPLPPDGGEGELDAADGEAHPGQAGADHRDGSSGATVLRGGSGLEGPGCLQGLAAPLPGPGQGLPEQIGREGEDEDAEPAHVVADKEPVRAQDRRRDGAVEGA